MKKIVPIIFIILLILSCFVSCSNQEAYSYTFTEFFNTTTNLLLYENESNADQISLSCKEKLRELENKLSLYKEDSDIYKYNRALFGTYVEVSFDTYNCVSKAKQIYLDTNGSFNPLMYRLSDLWGFTDRFSQENFEIEFSYDRENYKEQEMQIKTGKSIVFLWKKQADVKNATYKNIKKDMNTIFDKANLKIEQ